MTARRVRCRRRRRARAARRGRQFEGVAAALFVVLYRAFPRAVFRRARPGMEALVKWIHLFEDVRCPVRDVAVPRRVAAFLLGAYGARGVA